MKDHLLQGNVQNTIDEDNDQILHSKINKQYPKRIEEKMSLTGHFGVNFLFKASP